MIEGKAEQRGGRLVFVVVETSEPIGSDELLETETELPAKHAVCARCEGHGTHMREGMASHAYTAEEFDESFPDDESREQYFRRGGIYDVTCSVCAGRRVVVVVDEQAIATDEQRRAFDTYRDSEAERLRSEEDDRRTMRGESGEW